MRYCVVGHYWDFKGDYLDFSHLTKLNNIYISMNFIQKKKYISSITRNHTFKKKHFFDGIPLKGYVAS